MKKILSLVLVLSFLSSCKSKTEALESDNKANTPKISECPENAQCTQAILKNTALAIEDDGIGKPFYTVVEKTGTTVYQYKLTEDKDQQYVDGGYREEIVFELPSNFKNGSISGKPILQAKALFGVFCYCKGKAGYYSIQEGTITKTDKAIVMEIPALVEGQKLRTIKIAL